MNDEQLYKFLYEAAREDRKEANDKLCEYVLADLESKLGDFYWDFMDYVIVQVLKGDLDSLENLDCLGERPDTVAQDIGAAYRMLAYHTPSKEYEAWTKERWGVYKEDNDETF